LFIFSMKLKDFPTREGITALSSYGHSSSVLVACEKELFLLFGVNLLSGSVQFTKNVRLVSSVSLPSSITQIIPDPNGPRVALLGENFVAILSVPIELWSTCGVTELLQSKYFCECSFLQENIFLGEAQPIQLIWTTEVDGDETTTFLALLSSDCAIRFYELNASTGIDYPRVKVDLLSLMPLLSPSNSNRYGLFKSLASFTILSHFSRLWHVLLIDTDGESHIAAVYKSSAQTHSVYPLDLPIELMSARVVPSRRDVPFTSLVAASSNGVVHHLIALVNEESVDGIRVVDSVSLPSPIVSLSSTKDGALIHSTTALHTLDITPCTQYLTAIALGASMPKWEGMELVECARAMKECFLLSLPALSLEVENDSTILVYATNNGLESSTLFRQWESKWMESSKPGPSSVSSIKSIEEKLKEMLKAVKVVTKNIGSSKNDESEIISTLISTLTTIKHNFEVFRNCVHFASTSVVGDSMARLDAVGGARRTQDGDIISLYESLCQAEERLYNNRVLTEELVRKANILWNSLSNRSVDTEMEAEMMRTLKEHSKQLDEMTRAVPKVTLDMEKVKREISQSTESTTRLKRRANVVSIREEIEALESRCDSIEKMMV
ncbi:hypothetical protein PFISCL1PPCAC_6075, partial [Pristionchus fissidentatus]